MISAVYVTFNETEKIRRSIASLGDFAQEIIVLDLGSSDGIENIKEDRRVQLFSHPGVQYVEKVRNLSIHKAKGDWILVLDPDEQISKALGEELMKISKKEGFDAVNIPRKNIFFGSWISHTNFWPDRHIRFFKRNKIDWPDKIHTYPKVEGKILTLLADPNCALIHYGYDTRKQFIERQLRYAKAEAQNRLNEGKEFSIFNLVWMPLREFLARYIKHQEYLDGFNGIFIVLVLMWYQTLIQVNMLKK